jgi:uncharacterized tellurite resistance protein B-like protein
MNFSDFIKDSGKRINKEYYLHLIQVSKADGKIKPEEFELLHKEGRKFGLTDPEIDKLIVSESSHYNPPYLLQEKFDHLYNVAEMILADEDVTEGERKLLKRFAIEAGFSDKTIAKLIEFLLDGIRKGDDEETLFQRFRKEILFQD